MKTEEAVEAMQAIERDACSCSSKYCMAQEQACELALWLLRREELVRAMLDAPTIEAAMYARTELLRFERLNPMP